MRITVLLALVAVAHGSAAQRPRELEVWTARAIATVLAEIGPEFERTTGYRLRLISDLPAEFARRAKAGEPVDLVISTSATIDQWIRDGRIVAETRTEIARSGIGVEVRAGAPKPDISSVEALKRALLEAKSIAYLRVGSGIYIESLVERLGIADAIKGKVTRPETDIVSEMVARGEVELGLVVITQILTTPGVTLVGPLPPDVQSYVMFTGGVSSNARAPDAARQLITFLTGPTATPVVRAQGMEPSVSPPRDGSCFLLYELGVGEIRRRPSDACRTRVTPASTFKVPHALAALDAGVVSGPDEKLAYDGKGDFPVSARRDHTLASAIQNSVLWYFQRVAERLGIERESVYLRRLAFGNMDATSGLTTFWIGGSLQIAPEEQQSFWLRLYQQQLPVAPAAVEAIKRMLIQPAGVIVNAAGHQPFAAPWPKDVVVSAKTGSATDRSGQRVRWLVGHVRRGSRSFVFVSCAIGSPGLEPNAAIDLAARSLREEGVL